MLSEKSRHILEQIANGCHYDKILAGDDSLTYLDIFNAAREVLNVIDELTTEDGNQEKSNYQQRVEKIREKHPRAYEPWSEEEESRLINMYQTGDSIRSISSALQRQRGAIRSRIEKLGLDKRKSEASPSTWKQKWMRD